MIIPEYGNAIKIVDRVKNILKLQQGEYISPEKVENIGQFYYNPVMMGIAIWLNNMIIMGIDMGKLG